MMMELDKKWEYGKEENNNDDEKEWGEEEKHDDDELESTRKSRARR